MPVLLEREGRVATVVLDRPEKLNAIDPVMASGLEAAWRELAADDGVHVIVLTGSGSRAFCAGADLATLLPEVTAGGWQDGVGPEGNVFLKSLPLYKPIVAAVNGDALAGGTELLLATDIRVAVEEARFGLPEPRSGLLPAGGGTVRLPRQIPYCRAMEILLTGRLLSAQEALEFGLLNRVVPRSQLDDVVGEYVRLLLANGQVAIRRIKESVLATQGLPLASAFHTEARLGQEVFATEDAREGPRAFTEKRSARFIGR
jgi:enoyl-CoA hydratase